MQRLPSQHKEPRPADIRGGSGGQSYRRTAWPDPASAGAGAGAGGRCRRRRTLQRSVRRVGVKRVLGDREPLGEQRLDCTHRAVERRELPFHLDRAVSAVETLLAEGLAVAQNAFHADPRGLIAAASASAGAGQVGPHAVRR